ncbi:CBS domain-containing protein [Halogranum rubrum]|uniref:Signal transduction protein with CBS domain protein n=1 Tax=Halogranum salarium B-1 TaxID=1210908 RepID=J3JE55_9EURY|nr:CBS domain-containing protein [Halogranum salarium]EJN58071.1 signal transduction protein with CBS domain protein [Halogranum salarium B-1]
MNTETRTRVEDIMSSPVATISKTATVREAATQMREKGISSLLVTATEAGIVTSTDVLDVVADGRDPGEVLVGDVMTAPVETVTPDLFMEEVAAMMTSFGIKHLPVVDDDYVGMVSSTDVAAQLS